jgi:hypothetical protein
VSNCQVLGGVQTQRENAAMGYFTR